MRPKTAIFPSQLETLLWKNSGLSLHTGSRLEKCVSWILTPGPFPASFVACRVARPRARHLLNRSPLFPGPPPTQASRRRGAERCGAPFGVGGPVLLLFPFRVSIIGSTYGPDTVQIGVRKSGLEELFKFSKTEYNFRIKNFPYNVPMWTVFEPYMDRKRRNKWERLKTV